MQPLGVPTSSPTCLNSSCCQVTRVNDPRGGEAIYNRNRTQQKGMQSNMGGHILPTCQGTLTVHGAESTGTIKGSTRAYSLSSCHQLEQGGTETKAISRSSISFLFPLCLKFPWAGKRKRWCGGAGIRLH